MRDGVYLAPDAHYRIALPENTWEQVSRHGADLVLESTERPASILTSSLCGRYAKAGLDALSRNLFIGTRDRRVLKRGTVDLPAGRAERMRVEARLDDTVFRAEAYTLRKAPCVYDFVYLSRPDDFENGLPDFVNMMQSLRLGSGSAQ